MPAHIPQIPILMRCQLLRSLADEVNIMTLLKYLLNGSLTQLMLEVRMEKCHCILTTTFTANELLQIVLQRWDPCNTCSVYLVLAFENTMNIPCLYHHMLWWFKFPVLFTLSIKITMKRLLVECAMRTFEGDLNLAEEAAVKAYWQYLFR